MPQLRESDATADSHPLALSPSQSARPVEHAGPTMHAPATHVAVRPAGAVQTFPQRPHDDESVRVSTSQPFDAAESQSAKPVAQLTTWHAPDAQRSFALGRAHTRPHAPQCSVDVDRSVSHPAADVQSPRPVTHATC